MYSKQALKPNSVFWGKGLCARTRPHNGGQICVQHNNEVIKRLWDAHAPKNSKTRSVQRSDQPHRQRAGSHAVLHERPLELEDVVQNHSSKNEDTLASASGARRVCGQIVIRGGGQQLRRRVHAVSAALPWRSGQAARSTPGIPPWDEGCVARG